MAWFDYRQNNSGGWFDLDRKRGISVNVLIEAETPEQADDKAESIGLYFDGVMAGIDCGCCGDRWYRTHDEGSPVPMVWDEEVKPGDPFVKKGAFGIKWVDGPEGYLHYADGRIESFYEEVA